MHKNIFTTAQAKYKKQKMSKIEKMENHNIQKMY